MDIDRPRRRNLRLEHHDYSEPAVYYVTICVDNKHELFGAVVNGGVKHSEIGEIVKREWDRVPKTSPDVVLDEYVIMPNHMHAIVIIRPPRMTSTTLGNIIRQFKARATASVRRELNDPEAAFWQRGYHDHVVRGSFDLDRIREYIRLNPTEWERDEYR